MRQPVKGVNGPQVRKARSLATMDLDEAGKREIWETSEPWRRVLDGALASAARWGGQRPVHPQVAGSGLGQGACSGLGLDPVRGVREAADGCYALTWVCSLSPSLSRSKKNFFPMKIFGGKKIEITHDSDSKQL